jgi:hypothetical protein
VSQTRNRTSTVVLELDLRSLDLPGEAELGLIFRSRQQDESPMYFRNAADERMVIPVDLVAAGDVGKSAGSLRVAVELRRPADYMPDRAALYVFTDSAPRLLQEVPVTRTEQNASERAGRTDT